jgi:hypothetical protein
VSTPDSVWLLGDLAEVTVGERPSADQRMAVCPDVSISLTADGALVLFDLLHRWEDDDRVRPPQHASEQVALWNLSALL